MTWKSSWDGLVAADLIVTNSVITNTTISKLSARQRYAVSNLSLNMPHMVTISVQRNALGF